jgi:AraC-like DNA-binding protein
MLARPNSLRQSPNVSRDPLSDVLALVDAQSVLSGEMRASGRWAIRFPPRQIKFLAPVRGGCWLSVDASKRPRRLAEGDIFLLRAERPFVLASDLEVSPLDAGRLVWSDVDGSTTIGDGSEFSLLGGHVTLDAAHAWLLLDVLPPSIHLRASSDEAIAMRWLLQQLVRERTSVRPGTRLASSQLAQLLFVQVLRAHLALRRSQPAGWFRALGDPAILGALRVMHHEPGRRWELSQLAKAASMSRSTFASRFRAVVGVAPLTYLTEWRMRLAEKALREDSATIASLAQSLGYASESAFSHAFKRVTGSAPTRYRRHRRKSSTGRANSRRKRPRPVRVRRIASVRSRRRRRSVSRASRLSR